MAKQFDDTVKTLEPTTTKDWLVHMNNKLNAVMMNQANFADTQKVIDGKLDSVITCQATQDVRIDHLETRVNSWSTINSIGALLAAIMAAFGLKGS